MRGNAWWAREDSNLQPSGYAPVVCHCPAAADSYWNLNKIGVRSFILSGAPIPSSTYRTSPFEETKLKRFFTRFSAARRVTCRTAANPFARTCVSTAAAWMQRLALRCQKCNPIRVLGCSTKGTMPADLQRQSRFCASTVCRIGAQRRERHADETYSVPQRKLSREQLRTD